MTEQRMAAHWYVNKLGYRSLSLKFKTGFNSQGHLEPVTITAIPLGEVSKKTS